MKHSTLACNRMWKVFLIAVLLMELLVACGPECDQEQTIAPSEIAGAVLRDVGKLGPAFDGDKCRRVVVFEEMHTSRSGQIEIAIMLNRLYQEHGLRHLALEAAVLERDALSTSWFHTFPDDNIRREVALQLLGQGEISAAEFLAMIYPDFQLHPIERESEYAVEPSEEASVAEILYLLAIAEKSLTPEQIEVASRLVEEDADKYIDFVVGADPWVKSRFDSRGDLSAEEWIQLVDEIDAKTDEVGASRILTLGVEDLDVYSGALQELREFFVTASERSDTMVKNTIAIVNDHPEAPIAFVTGAAHTDKVAKLFEDSSVSFSVVSPLDMDESNGAIYTLAYDRKLLEQSVDPPGALGSYLDGRRKPRPVLNQPWMKKAAIMTSVTAIVRAAAAGAGGGKPPFGLDDRYLKWEGGEVVPSSIEVLDDGDIILAVQILEPERKELWVRAWQVGSFSDISDTVSLERALLGLLDEVKGEEPLSYDEQVQFEKQHSADDPLPTAFSRDVVGIVSTSEAVIRGIDDI